MALPEITALLWRQTKTDRKVLCALCSCQLYSLLHLLRFYSFFRFFFRCLTSRKWYLLLSFSFWFDFVVQPQTWYPVSNTPSSSSLPFCRVWVCSGAGPSTRSSFLSPLCSQTAEKPAAEWLDGTNPFPTHLRPLTEQRQEDGTILQSEKTHLNHQRRFSRWQPTGSTNCDTWPTSPVPCTHSPLTPCGATPPLTCWPVATSLAGLGQTFPKKWLHCVSNRKQQLWILATRFCEKCVFTEILFVFALRS